MKNPLDKLFPKCECGKRFDNCNRSFLCLYDVVGDGRLQINWDRVAKCKQFKRNLFNMENKLENWNSATYPLNVAPTDYSNNIFFYGEAGERIGRFFWKDGQLDFEGNATESAKVFINSTLCMVNEKLNYIAHLEKQLEIK